MALTWPSPHGSYMTLTSWLLHGPHLMALTWPSPHGSYMALTFKAIRTSGEADSYADLVVATNHVAVVAGATLPTLPLADSGGGPQGARAPPLLKFQRGSSNGTLQKPSRLRRSRQPLRPPPFPQILDPPLLTAII